MTGLRNAAAVSLKISIDSFSRASSTDGDEITLLIVVCRVFLEGIVEVKWWSCLNFKVSQRL